MCMQCVAGSAPYVSAGFVLLRGSAIKGWVQSRRRPAHREPAAPLPANEPAGAALAAEPVVAVAPIDDEAIEERNDPRVPVG